MTSEPDHCHFLLELIGLLLAALQLMNETGVLPYMASQRGVLSIYFLAASAFSKVSLLGWKKSTGEHSLRIELIIRNRLISLQQILSVY